MPIPTASITTYRPDIAGAMLNYDEEANRLGFIGLQVLPVFESNVDAGSFEIIPTSALLQDVDTTRAPRTAYKRGGDYKTVPHSFATVEHGLEQPVDRREAKIYRKYFDLEKIAARRARDPILRNQEKRIAAAVFDSGTFSPTQVTVAWLEANLATAKPISDVEAAVLRFFARTGIMPDTLIMNGLNYRLLRRMDEIVDKVKNVARVLPSDIGLEHLKAAFDIPKILVAGGAKNTANPNQDAVIASIWDIAYVAVAKTSDSYDLMEPCLGRTIHWGEDGSQIGGTIESYYEESVRADVIRCRMDTDEDIFNTDLCELVKVSAA